MAHVQRAPPRSTEEYKQIIDGIKPEYSKIAITFDSRQSQLHPSQKDLVHCRLLGIRDLIERPYVQLSIANAPLKEFHSICDLLRTILNYSERTSPEYALVISTFEFAVRGILTLVNMGSKGELGIEQKEKAWELISECVRRNPRRNIAMTARFIEVLYKEGRGCMGTER